MKARLSGIDEAKGIAIVLVVIGHAWSGLSTAGISEETPAFLASIQWIYSFHMPVFFVIAGMLAKRSLEKRSEQDFLTSKIRTLVYPYFAWSTAQWLLQRVFQTNGNADSSGSLFSILVSPIGQFWFLYALGIIYLIHALTKRFGLPAWGLLLLTFTFYLFSRTDFWSWEILYAVAGYSVFYALGACLPVDALRLSKYHGWLGLAGLAIVMLCVSLDWQKPLIGRLLVAIVGCGGLMAIGVWLSSQRWGMVFRELGKASLAIFVAHTIFSAGIRTVLLKLGFLQMELHLLLGILAGLVGPFLLLVIEKRLTFPYFFTWPSGPRSRSA